MLLRWRDNQPCLGEQAPEFAYPAGRTSRPALVNERVLNFGSVAIRLARILPLIGTTARALSGSNPRRPSLRRGGIGSVQFARRCSLTLFAAVLLAIAAIACGDDSAPSTVATEAEPAPAPQRPWIYVEYEGRLQAGRSGSYCWPVDSITNICGNVAPLHDFESAPTLRVKRGDEVAVVVKSEEVEKGEVMAEVITVLGEEPTLRLGEAVYSVTAVERLTFELPPDVYLLSLFYRSRLGSVSFGLRLEIVE